MVALTSNAKTNRVTSADRVKHRQGAGRRRGVTMLGGIANLKDRKTRWPAVHLLGHHC